MGDNSVMGLQNFPKVNQFTYTFASIYDKSIMTLAHAVLEKFCSQAFIGL